jgi:hypothetical protein
MHQFNQSETVYSKASAVQKKSALLLPDRLLCCVIVATFLVIGCGTSDEEAAIRKLIDQAADLAEKHQIGDLVRLTAEDFVATPGHHDANSVKALLFVTFRQYGSFNVLYPRPTVTLEASAQRASATIYFVIVRKDVAMPPFKDLYHDPVGWLEAVGEKADPYRLALDLIKQDRRWQVQRTHLERFTGRM